MIKEVTPTHTIGNKHNCNKRAIQ